MDTPKGGHIICALIISAINIFKRRLFKILLFITVSDGIEGLNKLRIIRVIQIGANNK
jgi:hypothetical protein